MNPSDETLYVVLVRSSQRGAKVSYSIGPYSLDGARRAAAEHPKEVDIGAGDVEVVPLYPPDPMDLAFVQPDHPRAVRESA